MEIYVLISHLVSTKNLIAAIGDCSLVAFDRSVVNVNSTPDLGLRIMYVARTPGTERILKR